MYATAAAVCLIGIVPTTSRAGMVIAMVVLAISLPAIGVLPVSRILRSRRQFATAVAMVLVILFGLVSAWRWIQVDDVEENRGALARAAMELAQQHAPLGSGIGGFVNAFMQGGSPLALGGEYVNHAHNEYVQWWMTGGVAAMLALVAVLGLIAVLGWLLMRLRPRDPVAVACWLGVCVVLAHSWVDFPLRTISIMSLAATLAGMSVAACRDLGMRPAQSARDGALQRA